jgi:tripartite-type tricarboxylate transporter receptor subunit TctC
MMMPNIRYCTSGNPLKAEGVPMRTWITLMFALFRHLKLGAILTGFIAGIPAAVQAQSFPSRPITVLVGLAAASGPDIMMRAYAEVLGRDFGQRVIVDNRTGAAGIIAASALTQAQPDGYTLLLALGGTHTIIPAMQNMPFDPIKDFAFITLLYSSPGLLLVPATSPIKTFDELAAYLKAKPGGGTYATPGIGSPAHLMTAMLQDRLGVTLTHLPYRGGGQVMMDLISGRFDFMFLSSIQAKSFVLSGDVRALAVGGASKIAWLPQVPTLAELGYSDVALESWFAVAAPKDTPLPIIEVIRSAYVKASQDPLIIKRASEEGATIRTGSREEVMTLLLSDYERLGNVVRKYNIKSE